MPSGSQGGSGEMRIVNGLVARLVQKLPCNSGSRVTAMESDGGFRTSVESLLQLASIRLSPVISSLLSSLDGLSRYTSANSALEVPLDILQSQIYILYLVDLCLSNYWQQQSAATSSTLVDLPMLWPDPPPLDDAIARQILSSVMTYARLVSSESNLYGGTVSPAPSKDGRGQASSIVSWGHGAGSKASTSTFTPQFFKSHSRPSKQAAREPQEGWSPALCTRLTSTVDCVSEMTRLIAQIIFYLSASNWPLILGRIKGRLSHLTTTIEDTPDLIELRLLEWSSMNRQRLGQTLQEASNTFLHIKRPSQIAFASVLHAAIWNWLEGNPIEFGMLVESNRRIEGGPDGLFDILFSMADFSSANAKRAAVFYPLMAGLLVLSPDAFKKVAVGDAGGKASASTLGKKFSFLESLRKGLSGNKGFEPSVACYLDFIKAATLLSPKHEQSGLRNILPDVQNDLKDALFFGAHSNDLADTRLPLEGLVALYRANPRHINSTVLTRLWVDSDISKVVAVKACARMKEEGDRLPWFPSVSDLRSDVALQLRNVLKASVSNISAERGGLRRPRVSTETSPVLLDLLDEVLALYESDPSFALSGTSSSQASKIHDGASDLLAAISSLIVGHGPDALKLQAKRTVVAICRRIEQDHSAASDRLDINAGIASSAWQILLNASRQLLFAFHSGDPVDLTLACEILRDTSEAVYRLSEISTIALVEHKLAGPALTVASVAVLTSLAGPDVEQTSLSAPTLSVLCRLIRRTGTVSTGGPHASPNGSSAQSQDIQSQLALLEELGRLPPATGRQQQQRQVRRAFRQHAQPSDVMSAVWIGLSHRLKTLMGKMGRAAPVDNLGRRVPSASILAEDETKEWQNLNALVAATAACGFSQPRNFRLGDLLGQGFLPHMYEETPNLTAAISTFIAESANLLLSSSIVIRESVKEALGSDLPLVLGRNLVSALYNILSHSIGPSGIILSESFNAMVEQSVSVIRLLIERLQPDDPRFDVTEMLFLMGRYLTRLGKDDHSLRTKLRFCQLIETVLGREGVISVGQESLLRNSLLEWMTEWSIETQKDSDVYQNSGADRSRPQRDLDYACLSSLSFVTEGMVLKSTTDTSDDTPMVVKARLFQRYLHQLTKVIEKSALADDVSARHRAVSVGAPSASGRSEESGALALLVLSNLLASNIDVGLKHCLSLGYHEDPLFRSAFVQIMSNLLRNGARFGGLSGQKTARRPTPYLDVLVDDNLAFAVTICEVAPPADVDEMLALLFRSLEAKGTLLSLIKVMIEKEVAQTNHESELFRANSVTTKMLTVFGKTYGYNYVRATLQPLVHSLVEKPAACSFELDPSKAGPNEDIDQNAEHLRLMCQALLDLICTSASRVPVMFRALCHQLWEIVEDRFPDSRHSAVGSFIFLRFFCPAIVSPEAIDLAVPAESREVRRALLLITKVIQNLANNVKFKEPHMQILNAFLAENIKQVTRFLSDVAVRPKGWELAQAVKTGAEEAEKLQEAEVDNVTLQRFLFKNYGRIQPTLETMPPSYRRSITPRSARADIDGKAVLAKLIEQMRSTGESIAPTASSPSAKAQAYEELMRQNTGRDTSSVAKCFYEGPASQNGRRIFYFIVSETAFVDYDLLAYHIFSTVESVVESFDVVIDLTDFSPAVDLPRFWLQRIAQVAPQSLLPLVNVVALYNANSYAKRRVRRIIADLVPISGPVGKSIVAACSPVELGEAIPFTTLSLPDYTMALAFEAEHVFTNLLRLSDHEAHVPVVIKVGADAVQVASWRKQDLAPSLKAYVIDVIKLKDIDDIVMGTGPTADHLTIKYSQSEQVVFVSRKCNELAYVIRSARARVRITPSEERALRPTDVPGTLLNIALLNLSATDDNLRLGAYNLVSDVAKFFSFDLHPAMPKVNAGLMMPSNAISFARNISRGLAKRAPQLTLEFLKEWTIGFAKADMPQKTACVLYVSPWILNLNTFAKRSRDDSVDAIKQIGEIIRSFISITISERKRLHLSLQEHIWSPLANSPDLSDILLSELLDAAVDGGLGSDRVECVGDILCSISSISTRGKVVARLRKTIAQTYLKPSNTLADNVAWAEICALARINCMLAFAPGESLDTTLFIPELMHVLTLLVGCGPLIMRQTIYGLFMNALQALASSSPADGMDSTALQQALDRAQSQNLASCFGLATTSSGLELIPGPLRDEVDISFLNHVDTLARFLGDVLTAAAPNLDCANAWRARWMGLVVGTCFQHNPATQPQAFTVLGYLAADEVDDDLVYQILVAMSTTLSHMTDTDSVLLNSMLRCLSRVVPGLLPDSRYASSLFWLAFAIAEMGYIPLFGAALDLMLTALKSLNDDGSIEKVPQHLFDTRNAMDEAARKIDQIAGISFDQEPSFCLVAVILKGVRHPSTKDIAIKVLIELLRLTAAQGVMSASDDDAPLIPKDSVAYFAALLPASANSPEEMRALFVAAGLEVDNASLKDMSTLSVFDLLSIPDNSSAIFLVTLIVTNLNSAPSDAERLVLYRLLADASAEMPEVLSMAYDSLLPRLSATLNTSSNPALIQNASIVLSRALADPSYSFPTSGPLASDSQTSLQQSFQASISSAPGVAASGGPMIGVLDDLGMTGLGEGGFTAVKPERLSMMAKWIAALIESFTI